MKKKAKKLNFKKIILFLFIIGLIIYFHDKYDSFINSSSLSNIGNSSGYKTIKLDNNKNYSGMGQERVKNLKTNRPILICVWNQPHDNRWTTASHYMVLLATDGNELVYVSNPNRRRK